MIGQKVLVDGEVLVPNDYGRITAVLSDESYSKTVLNLVTLSPLALQVISKKIQY